MTSSSFSLRNCQNENLRRSDQVASIHKKKPGATTPGLDGIRKDTTSVGLILAEPRFNYNKRLPMDEENSQRFIKLIDSPTTDWLQENYPNAFLLLSYIVRIARKNTEIPDGLIIGDAIIGEIETSRKSGLSRKQYRNALEKLIELGMVELVYNPKSKNGQKRAIKRAIKSKVVNIIDSKVYDINKSGLGEQNGERGANKGRTRGDKQRSKEVINKVSNVSSCSGEPSRPSTPDLFFCFQEKKFIGITDADLAEWQQLYPELDIKRELLSIKQWAISNPTKARAKKLWRKTLLNWFRNENEKMENKKFYREMRGSFADSTAPEQNREFAQKLAERTAQICRQRGFQIDILHQQVEIMHRRSNMQPTVIGFSEKGFKEQLQNALRKYQLLEN